MAKFLVTCGLLIIIGAQINITELVGVMIQLDWFHLVIAVMLALAAVILSAYKWQILLHSKDLKLGLKELTKIYFLGLFFNNFLPSSIGGDVVRAVRVAKLTGQQVEAAASVVMERLLATFALGFLALLALIPNSQIFHRVYLYLGGILGTCLLIGFLVWRQGSSRLFRVDSRRPWLARLKSGLGRLVAELNHYRQNPAALAAVFGWSVVFQLLIVLINIYIFKAMGLSGINWWRLLLVVPLISAISMLPFSINGLGVREGAYLMLLNPLGISATKAVTGSLVFFVIVTVLSLAGGVFYMLEGFGEGVVLNGQRFK